MKLRVQCSPEHARKLALRAATLDEFEIAAALQILADDLEGYRRALTEHHALHNLPATAVWGDDCPICRGVVACRCGAPLILRKDGQTKWCVAGHFQQ